MLLTALYASSLTPTPSPSPEFDETLITPGPIGFLVMAIIAVAAVLIAVDMVRRVRRVRYREEVRAEIALEKEEQLQRDSGASDAPTSKPTAPPE